MDADINCFNMEFPLSDEYIADGTIWCPKSYVKIVKDNKMNFVNIANNHIFDQWIKWFRDTVECLKSSWIMFFWWWLDYRNSHEPAIFEKDWMKIWFLWYFQNTRTNINYVCSAENKPWINPICEEEIIDDIQKTKVDYWCDFVFVHLHWDVENHKRISGWYKRVCRKIIEAWWDWVFWHHSHIPKKYEIYKWKPIFYSFWNFVFWQYNKRFWSDNIFARLVINNKKIENIQIYNISWTINSVFKPQVICSVNLQNEIK